ncbi:MAG: glycosyltransferase family 39 protein, partial [bacterium]
KIKMNSSFLNKKIRSQYFWLLLIIVLAVALRLINIGTEPYWGDEVLSLDIVHHYSQDLPGLISYVDAIEVHPPLYYIFLYGWSRYSDFGEMGIRLLSLFFSIGGIVLVYLLTHKLFNDKRAGLLAAFLTAVLPIQIEFGQEARPYIIFTFFGLLAALSYWHYRDKKKLAWLFVYALATLAGIYLHYSYVFFATALALFWLLENILEKDKQQRSREIVIWLIAHALIFLAFFRQLVVMLYKIVLSGQPLLDLPRTVSPRRDALLFDKVYNQLLWLSKNLPFSKLEIFMVFFFKLFLASCFVWFLYKQSDKLKSILQNHQRQLLFVVWMIILPVVLYFFSPQAVPYTTIYSRHILPVSLFLMILLAYFACQLKPKLKWLLVVVFIMSIMNFTILIVGNDANWDPYHRLKVIADHINYAYQPGDLVLQVATSGRTDFNHFLRPEIPCFGVFPLKLLDYQDDFMSSRETLGLIENESQLRVDLNGFNNEKLINIKMNYLNEKYHPQRVWIIAYQSSLTSQWFIKNNWREAMVPLGSLFPVQLYVKR